MPAPPTLLLALFAVLLCSPLRLEAAEPLDLAVAVALAEDPEELARTWDRGFVAIPAPAFCPEGKALFGMVGETATKERLAELAADVRLPVILYLHGCAGLGVTVTQLPLIAERAGFAVLALDSFGRSLRRKNCDSTTRSSGMFPPALLYRRAELIHAVGRLRQLPWVDPERILLAGFSEGGAAIALWGGEVEVAGYVVLSWTCTAPPDWDWLSGLRTPPDRPVLAMVSRDDPWYAWPGWQGGCGAEAHAGVQSIVLDHSGHEILYYPEAQAALLEFLRGWSD